MNAPEKQWCDNCNAWHIPPVPCGEEYRPAPSQAWLDEHGQWCNHCDGMATHRTSGHNP